MALKLRGSSQVKDGSITLNKIKDLQSGKILGRAVDTNYTGKPLDPNNPESIVELGAEDVRRISGLWELDTPTFKGLNLNKFDNLGGNLSVEGTGNIDGDFSVNTNKFKITGLSGNLDTLGTMTSQGDIKLTDASDVDQHHLKASDGSLTSAGLIRSKSSIEVNDGSSKFLVSSAGNVTVVGEGDFDKSVYVGDSITLFGTVDADNGKISSKLLTVGDTNAQLVVDINGNVSIDKNLSVSGTLSVGSVDVGTISQIDTEHLHVKDSMIMLADGNTATDLLDIGFVGTYNDGTDQLFTGLVRDADDSIFKLFDKSSESLTSDNEVDFSNADLKYGHLHLNKITLMGDGSKFIGDVEGTLTGNADTTTALAAGIDFSIGTSVGDTGDITAAIVSSDGSTNVELSATINSGAVDFAHLNDASVVSSTETLAAVASDSDVMVPTAAAVIDYVESKVASGGFDNVSDMDLKMGINNSFVSVEEVVVNVPVNATIEQNDNFSLTTDIEDAFKSISQVYINGQKIRYAKDTDDQNTLYDYWFSDVSTVNFKDGILNSGDNIELRYYVQTSGAAGGGGNQAQGGNQNNNPTYNASTANGETSVNEGASLTINTTTTNVADGTTLHWTVSNAGDFAVSSGSFVINSNSGSFSVTLIADKTTEAVAETFDVSIRTVSTEGVVVASVSNITINDTSQTPTYSVSTANGETSVNEGVTLNMNVSTTDVDDGATLYWTVSNAGDFDVSSGSFVINSDSGSFSVTPTADNTTEATAETFAVSIRINAVDGNVVATSSDITINDTSQSSSYTLSATNTTIAEAYGSTTITLSAPEENVGAFVPYTISGVDTDDFRGGFLSTPIDDISRINLSTGVDTSIWNLICSNGTYNSPAYSTTTSGVPNGGSFNWSNIIDSNVSSYAELTVNSQAAYPYPGVNWYPESHNALKRIPVKAFVISGSDGYPIGDFELWGHTTESNSGYYHNYNSTNPAYTPESRGWTLLKTGTSTSVNGQSDYFNLGNNEVVYTNYMVRFINHTHAGNTSVRIAEMAFVDQELQSGFDYSSFSINLQPTGEGFGSSVDCSADGNIFVVGEFEHDGDTYNNEGAVYTYQRSDVDGSIQRIAQDLKMPQDQSQSVAWFGSSVTISSDAQTLVVAAAKYDNDGITNTSVKTDSGTFFTYRWNSDNSEWDLLGSRFKRNIYSQYDKFGSSVALTSNGKKLVVGCEGDDSAGSNAGAVYTYEWNEDNLTWDEIDKMVDDANSHNYAFYGSSVDVSHDGNLLVVGAREFNNVSNNRGRVYTYEWDYVTSSWNLLASIDGAQNEIYFGSDVALTNIGDILCVSSKRDIYRYKWNSDNTQWDLVDNIIEFDNLSDLYQNLNPSIRLAICLSEYGDFMYVGNENSDSQVGNLRRYILLEQLDLTGNFVIDENKESTLDILANTGLTLENTKNLELTLDGTSESLIIDIEDSTSFYLNSSSIQLDEGQSVLIKFSSDNIAVGTVVPYVIEGDVTVNDFNPTLPDLTGQFIVGEDEDASFTFKNDLITEGSEIFTLRIPTTNDYVDVNILDTSITPTYTLEAFTETGGVETVVTSVDEGDSFKFRLTHQNLPEGVKIPYEIKGVSSDDFSPNLEIFTGEFTIEDGTASYSTSNFNLNLDRLTENSEIVTFEITDHLQNVQSTDITINDTSLSPSYSMDVRRSGASILSTVYRMKVPNLGRYDHPQNYNYLHCKQSSVNGQIQGMPEVGEHFYLQSGETTGTRYYLGKIISVENVTPTYNTPWFLVKLGEPDDGVVTGDSVYVNDLESHGSFPDEGYAHLLKIHEHVGTVDHCIAYTQNASGTWNIYGFAPTYGNNQHSSPIGDNNNVLTRFEDGHLIDDYIYANEIEVYDMVGRNVYTGNYTTIQNLLGQYGSGPIYNVLMGTVDKVEVGEVTNDGVPYNYILTITPDQDFINSGSEIDHYYFRNRLRYNSTYPHISIKSSDGSYDEFKSILSSEYENDNLADGFDVNDSNTGFKEIFSRASINEISNNQTYSTVDIVISTTNLESGFEIPFSISGDNIHQTEDFNSIQLTNTDVSSNDNHQLDLTGMLTVPSDGSGNNITINIKEDGKTEGVENFRFEITKHDNNVELVEIKIIDDSLDSFVLSALSNGSPVSSINEGDEITFQVNGSGQLDNTSFNYELKGVSVDDFEPSLNSLTGTLTFQNEIASLPLTFKNDISFDEGVEVIIFETEDSRNVKQSISVNIIDSSVETTNVSILRNGSSILSGSHVKEGDVLKFVLGTNVANGTPIPYEIKGVSADDFNPTLGSLTGQFIAGSSEEVELTLKDDATLSEGDEVLTFEFTGSHGQISSVNLNVIDSSEQFTVVDILRNDSPISSGSDVNEGDNIKFVLDTNAPNGTSIPYEIKGVSVGDFNPNLSSLTGTLTVGSDEILSLNLKEDISFSEGDEVLTFEFTKPSSEISSVNLNVVDSSQEILTIDILKNASSVLSGSHVNEGDVVKFVLNTNLSAGTLIPYEIKGVSADDFNPTLGSLTGQFMVGSSEEVELTLKNDTSFDEGDEVLTFEFTKPSSEISSVNLNVVDSSQGYVNVIVSRSNGQPFETFTSSGLKRVGEGEGLTYVLDTNVPAGTIIPYVIEGDVTVNDFDPTLPNLTGQFVVGSSEQVELILKNDISSGENGEDLHFKFTKPSGEIGNVEVYIMDTSVEYLNINILRNDSPISSGSAVNEGDNIKFVLDTNVSNKSISWDITGVSKFDFDPRPSYLNGSLTEGSNETLELNLKDDMSFSEGDETLTFEYNDLDGVTQSINLLVTDSSYESYTLSTFIVLNAGTANEQEMAGSYLSKYDEKGQTLRVKLVTENVPDGTTINYSQHADGTVGYSDFDPNRQVYGSFTVNNNQSYEDFKFDSSNEETFIMQLNSPFQTVTATAYINHAVESYKFFRIQQTRSWSSTYPKYMRLQEVEINDPLGRNALRDSSYSFTTTTSSDGSGAGDPSFNGRAGAYDGSTYYQWHNHYSIYPNDAMFYQFNFTTEVDVSEFRFYQNYSMRDFKILGSNDGQNWDVLREFSDFPQVYTPTASYPDSWITIDFS